MGWSGRHHQVRVEVPSRAYDKPQDQRSCLLLVHVHPAVVLAALVLAPASAADHAGSNHGLAILAPLGLDGLVHRLPDVQASFAEWEAKWPNVVDRMQIGKTSSGFPLESVRITDESIPYDDAMTATGEKLRVYLDGGHHGNEFLGVELVMYYLEDILTQAAAGDAVTVQFLTDTEIYATPIINVDGNFLDARKNSNHVDLNRNYDYQWGGPGSSSLIADQEYKGPSPASEAEVLANMQFATKIRPDLWITMHSGVAEFYWPWGWTNAKAPDWQFFESLEGPFEAATNGRVDAMQAAELYLAAGATDDWAYAVLGVPGHTFEVHEDQFVPIYGEPISEIIKDQLAGLDFMVQNVTFMGGWLDLTAIAGNLAVTNLGWGPAYNVTFVGADGTDGKLPVRLDNGTAILLPEGTTSITYQPLAISTSKVRTVPLAEPAPAVSVSAPVESPGAPLGIALFGLAALALARQR